MEFPFGIATIDLPQAWNPFPFHSLLVYAYENILRNMQSPQIDIDCIMISGGGGLNSPTLAQQFSSLHLFFCVFFFFCYLLDVGKFASYIIHSNSRAKAIWGAGTKNSQKLKFMRIIFACHWVCVCFFNPVFACQSTNRYEFFSNKWYEVERRNETEGEREESHLFGPLLWITRARSRSFSLCRSHTHKHTHNTLH